MEKMKLVKPQSAETVENAAVYACESLGMGCPCGGDIINYLNCGGTCGNAINVYFCGNGCGI